ncbi:MAG TPA: YdeI/OmpD-associated family protein [Candidatus Dormibacteraeota bacterium]
MPTPHDVQFFESSEALRAWLEANHEHALELWVGMYRKRTGRPSLTWPEVVDQVLCFGWIDGVRAGLDRDSYANRITPRKRTSNWSAVNIRNFARLRELGLVRPRGLAAFEARVEERSRVYSYESAAVELDGELGAAFRAEAPAWTFFQAQSPSYRRVAAHWVVTAKRDETRQRRLAALIACSARHERLPALSAPGRSGRG